MSAQSRAIEDIVDGCIRFSAHDSDLGPELGETSHAGVAEYCHDRMTWFKYFYCFQSSHT
jgi:hypothetical protein